MPKHTCAMCGNAHDYEGIEPAFRKPDAWSSLSERDRESSHANNDLCVINYTEQRKSSAFVRCVLPVRVITRDTPLHWGIWAQISGEAFRTIVEHWSDPNQGDLPPMRARLANDIPGYPPTRGLDVWIELQPPPRRASVRIDDGVDHPFATLYRRGVDENEVAKWMHAMGIV